MKELLLLIIIFLSFQISFPNELMAQDARTNSKIEITTQESKIQTNKETANKSRNTKNLMVDAISKGNNRKNISEEKAPSKPMQAENINLDFDKNNNLRMVKATEWNAYATIAIAILTILLAIETVRLRLIQAKQIKNLKDETIKPKVELFIDINRYSINFLEIHLVNNGNGTANNIKFIFVADKNEAIETSNLIISKIEKINFFKIGLKHLGAGQSKKSFLMSATEKEFGGSDIFFKSTIFSTITCEDDLGKEYTYKYTITMSEFVGMRSIGADPTKEMANSLKKLSESFDGVVSFSSGQKRIQSDIYDDSSREREEKETRDWIEKQKRI